MTLLSLLLLAIGLVLLGGSSGVVISNLVAIVEKRRRSARGLSHTYGVDAIFYLK